MINRKHPDIERPYNELKQFVVITGRKGIMENIYFSTDATRKYNLQPGNTLEFDDSSGDNVWTFVVNNSPDGFLLHSPNSKKKQQSPRVIICSKGLVAMIKRKNPNLQKGKRYPLKYTGNKLDGLPIIQILFHQPMTKIVN